MVMGVVRFSKDDLTNLCNALSQEMSAFSSSNIDEWKRTRQHTLSMMTSMAYKINNEMQRSFFVKIVFEGVVPVTDADKVRAALEEHQL